MSNLQPLYVRPRLVEPSFKLDGRIGLPVAVQTAAYVVPLEDDLYLWINGPDGGETTQLRITKTRQIEELPMLDIVTGGAVYCQKEFILTGTDLEGRPVVLRVTTDGIETWRTVVEGTLPTIWPSPYCIGQPVIVWQTSPDRMYVAEVKANRLSHLHSVDVAMPSIKMTSDGQAIYAVWADSSGVRGFQISVTDIKPIHSPMPYPDNLAIGTAQGTVFIAWQQGHSVSLGELNAGAKALHILFDASSVSGFTLVSGSKPLLWMQQNTYGDHEDIMHWSSALALPHGAPLLIDGLVHRVAWWGDTLVVVGSLEILFFKSTS